MAIQIFTKRSKDGDATDDVFKMQVNERPASTIGRWKRYRYLLAIEPHLTDRNGLEQVTGFNILKCIFPLVFG